MSGITYQDDDIEDMTAPGLKLVMIILYILPAPLAYIAFRDFLIVIIFQESNDLRWGIGTIIVLLAAAFCWISATGIHLLKQWAPKFVNIGLILIITSLVFYIVVEPEFPTLREVGTILMGGILIVLISSILIIRKNRDIFTN